MKDKRDRLKLLLMGMVTVGVILIADQLYLFGIGSGPFLPDLSSLDITGSEEVHHYQVGILLLMCSLLIWRKKRQ